MNCQILSCGAAALELRSKMSLILAQLAFSIALSVMEVADIWCVRGVYSDTSSEHACKCAFS